MAFFTFLINTLFAHEIHKLLQSDGMEVVMKSTSLWVKCPGITDKEDVPTSVSEYKVWTLYSSTETMPNSGMGILDERVHSH